MEKLNVTIELMPVSADINAKPGDRIMVFGGVAIGVYTGKQIVKDDVIDSKPLNKKQSAGIYNGLREKILEVLRLYPNMTSASIKRHLKIKPKTPESARIAWVINRMRAAKIIQSFKGEGKPNSSTVYSLSSHKLTGPSPGGETSTHGESSI